MKTRRLLFAFLVVVVLTALLPGKVTLQSARAQEGSQPETALVTNPVYLPAMFKAGFTPVAAGKIVFRSKRTDNWGIYTMNPDGSNQKKLVTSGTVNEFPSWNSDATKVTWDSNRDGSTASIYKMNSDGSSVKRLTNDAAQDLHPAWSPNSSYIAWDRSMPNNLRDIWRMNQDGSSFKQLTENHGKNTEPSWSPDSSHIVFISTRSDSEGDIYVMENDGDNESRLLEMGGTQSDPAWSRDGNWIAFASGGDIWKVKTDGSGLVNLTNSANVTEANPTWSPDSSQIAMTYQVKTESFAHIWIMSANGASQGLKQITTTDQSDSQPNWSK